jgi:hypothetical protein
VCFIFLKTSSAANAIATGGELSVNADSNSRDGCFRGCFGNVVIIVQEHFRCRMNRFLTSTMSLLWYRSCRDNTFSRRKNAVSSSEDTTAICPVLSSKQTLT